MKYAVYSKRFTCWLECDENGRAFEDSDDVTGYKRTDELDQYEVIKLELLRYKP